MTTPAAPPAAPETPVALTTEEIWPFAGLRVVSDDLELRYLDDDLLFRLAEVAAQGVHAEDAMPFTTPWTRGTPLDVARSVVTYHWGGRGAVSGTGNTRLELAVLSAGEPVGIQGFFGTDVAITRTVETGSWLGLAYQGHGIGTRMRRLVLHLLFEGLGLDVAVTTAFADNAPSNGVTRRIGYEPNGVDVVAREGKPALSNRYRLTREAWEAQADRPDVELHGVAPVRSFLGLDAGPSAPSDRAR
ncbi:GNAT family protein [Luteimicrobium xylanilyticum]|uniref:Succinyl-CoA transferase n=1 Tax=Luteimicrobium xylanilyticum TaxID=1133546 RepID=A0A5P9QAE5_9MICO|nr:GNAT family protein [Luteimicrobium xylanilyticum]QFU98438.1 Putative succinyl-CoA transferase [Luteimicrobium xylanilyticum]